MSKFTRFPYWESSVVEDRFAYVLSSGIETVDGVTMSDSVSHIIALTDLFPKDSCDVIDIIRARMAYEKIPSDIFDVKIVDDKLVIFPKEEKGEYVKGFVEYLESNDSQFLTSKALGYIRGNILDCITKKVNKEEVVTAYIFVPYLNKCNDLRILKVEVLIHKGGSRFIIEPTPKGIHTLIRADVPEIAGIGGYLLESRGLSLELALESFYNQIVSITNQLYAEKLAKIELPTAKGFSTLPNGFLVSFYWAHASFFDYVLNTYPTLGLGERVPYRKFRRAVEKVMKEVFLTLKFPAVFRVNDIEETITKIKTKIKDFWNHLYKELNL